MAHKEMIVAFGMLMAAAPLSASTPESVPATPAPAASADAKYCLRVDPITGSLIETVKCWTREQWADQGVDVDKEWAENGVTVKE
jgi:hypothetical protein